jgi:hypothetical protein
VTTVALAWLYISLILLMIVGFLHAQADKTSLRSEASSEGCDVAETTASHGNRFEQRAIEAILSSSQVAIAFKFANGREEFIGIRA